MLLLKNLIFAVLIVSALILVCSSVSSSKTYNNNNADTYAAMDTIALLTDGWTMRSTNPAIGIPTLSGSYPFKVPGTVFGNLLQFTNIYPKNLLDGNALKKIDPRPFSVPWVFSYKINNFPFDLFPNQISSPAVVAYIIRFKGINYKCDLEINGVKIAWQKDFVGTFREFSYDFSNAVNSSSSSSVDIKLTMVPPVDDVFPPVNPSTSLARTWIDWAPPPPDASMGIWRDVEIIQRQTGPNVDPNVNNNNKNTKNNVQRLLEHPHIKFPENHHKLPHKKISRKNIQGDEPTTTTSSAPLPPFQNVCYGGEIRHPQVRVKFPQNYSAAPRGIYDNVQIWVDALFEIPDQPTSSASATTDPTDEFYTFQCELTVPSFRTLSFNSDFFSIEPGTKSKTITAVYFDGISPVNPATFLYSTDLWWPWQMDAVNQKMEIDNPSQLLKNEANMGSLSCTLISATFDGIQDLRRHSLEKIQHRKQNFKNNKKPLPHHHHHHLSSSPAIISCTCVSSITNVKVGIRQSESTVIKIADGEPVRQFFINKVPILIRGAGWAPQLWYNDTVEDYENTFLYTRAMYMNAVRLEGKFPHDSFYETADKYGIIVLEGFSCCDAWQHWPAWTDETFHVANESLRYQLRRLRRFASVSTFFYSSDELPPEKVEKMYLQTFDAEIWPNVKISSAANVTSNISSFSAVKMSGPYSIVPPNYWTLAGKKFFLGGNFGFLTEGGPGENPAGFQSELKMTTNAEGNLNASLLIPAGTAELVNYHMGNPAGLFYNLRFLNPYINNRYGAPATPYDFAEYSQLSNYEAQSSYQESYNGNKYNATGYVQWMLNSAWPSNLWNLYDYYYTPGGAFFGTQSANRIAFWTPQAADNMSLEVPFGVTPWFDWSSLSLSLYNGAYVHATNVDVIFEVFVLSASELNSTKPQIGINFVSRTAATIPHVGADGIVQDALKGSLPPQVPGRNDGSTKAVQIIRLTARSAPINTNPKQPKSVENSRVYWRSAVQDDVLDWNDSNFYRTPCSQYADMRPIAQVVANHQGDSSSSALSLLQTRGVSVSACIVHYSSESNHKESTASATTSNTVVRVNITRNGAAIKPSSASFLLMASFEVVDARDPQKQPVRPVLWDDNYITMLPATTSTFDSERIIHARLLDGKKHNDGSSLLVRMGNVTWPVSAACH